MLDRFSASISTYFVQSHSGERSHQFKCEEAGLDGLQLAPGQDRAAETAPSVRRIDEKRSDLGRLATWIELRFVTLSSLITSKQRAPLTPSAAGRHSASIGKGYKISLVTDDCGIDSEGTA